ncbi:type II toxin-antitoxin system VapB family antitoxin [Antarcticirhabdus aurantiaca]|uniref:Type II toxin-antitoxin system VapB family antitoxin n=1 Tax=Antarcticirhabdus aurantiaca TaxID=2606717 RepID=A0ACD4NI54_9HYPH|nr:type II toxin-antitoxin system VapB family antitoxin [Antarcticirhabdus aurantiaca]WAJ26484.1 type II toxin-antitoxin system VapB family antitoxin [Jeongeuplla avenae]
MALHIRDEETDALVRELASRRGIGLTEAVRVAVENELARERKRLSLRERLKPLVDEVARARKAEGMPDKAFYDELWGQADG